MDGLIREKLLRLYEDVDRRVAAAGPVCVASGKCCRFREYGHTLFLSGVEAAFLLENAPPPNGTATADSCPYQRENLCTAREPRPLGCRIYFCDPAYQSTAQEITESSLRQLKVMAEEMNFEWRYAPLHVFLNQPELALPHDSSPRKE